MHRSFVIFAAFPAAVAALGASLPIGGKRNEKGNGGIAAPTGQPVHSHEGGHSASAQAPADLAASVTKTHLPMVHENAWMCAIGGKTILSSQWDATAQILYYAFGPDGTSAVFVDCGCRHVRLRPWPSGYPTVGQDPIVPPEGDGVPDPHLWPGAFTRSALPTNPGGSLGTAGPGQGPSPFFLAGMMDFRPATILTVMYAKGQGNTMAVFDTHPQNQKPWTERCLHSNGVYWSNSFSREDGKDTLLVYTNTPAKGRLAQDQVAALRTYCEDSSEANKEAVVQKFGGTLRGAMVMALPAFNVN